MCVCICTRPGSSETWGNAHQEHGKPTPSGDNWAGSFFPKFPRPKKIIIERRKKWHARIKCSETKEEKKKRVLLFRDYWTPCSRPLSVAVLSSAIPCLIQCGSCRIGDVARHRTADMDPQRGWLGILNTTGNFTKWRFHFEIRAFSLSPCNGWDTTFSLHRRLSRGDNARHILSSDVLADGKGTLSLPCGGSPALSIFKLSENVSVDLLYFHKLTVIYQNSAKLSTASVSQTVPKRRYIHLSQSMSQKSKLQGAIKKGNAHRTPRWVRTYGDSPGS